MMQEGHVLREPRYSSTVCSRYMAATAASASLAGSVLYVYRCVKLAFKYVAAVCGVRVGQPVHELVSERVMSPVAALCMWNVLMIPKCSVPLKYIVQVKAGLH